MSQIIHWGDCVAGIASLADKSLDHVITDPPYSDHVHANSRSGKQTRKGNTGTLSASTDLGFDAISDDIMTAAARQFSRVARRWVIVFTSAETISAWADALTVAGLEYVRTGAWIKEGATPQFTGDRPAMGFEAIVIAHAPGKKRWNGGGRHALWTTPIVRGVERTEHTTQKPLELMEALIRDFTDPGELICDPFAGSGTTAVACKKLGRNFIGWEAQKKYVTIANRRIEEMREHLSLFDEGAA